MKRHKLALATGVLARGWIQFVTFLMFAIAARYLGLEDFGRFTLAMVFVNIVQAYLYSGVYEFILKADRADRLDRTLLVSNLGFSIVGAGLSTLAGLVIGHATGDSSIGAIAAILAPSAVLAGANAACEAMVLRSQGYTFYNLTWIVAETIGCVVCIAMLLGGWGITSLIAYRYVQACLALAAFLIVGRVRFDGQIKGSEFARILRFAGPIYFSRVIATVSEYGADLVIGILVNPAAAGLYRLASRIVSGLTEVILQPLRVVSWARSSRAGRNPAKIALTILQVARLCATALLPLVVIVGFLAGPAISIGLGPAWSGAVPLIVVLMMARALSIFELILEPLLIGLGRNRLLLVTRLFSILVLFGLLFATASIGTEYVGVARLASTAVGAGAALAVLIAIVGSRRTFASLKQGGLLALGCLAVLLPVWLLPLGGGSGLALRFVAVALLSAAIAASLVNSSRRLRIGGVKSRPRPA